MDHNHRWRLSDKSEAKASASIMVTQRNSSLIPRAKTETQQRQSCKYTCCATYSYFTEDSFSQTKFRIFTKPYLVLGCYQDHVRKYV